MKAAKNLSVVLVVLACLPLWSARASFTILNETYYAGGEGWYEAYDVTQSHPSAAGEAEPVASHATRYSNGSDLYFEVVQSSYWGNAPQPARASLVVDFRCGGCVIEAWRDMDNYSWAWATLTRISAGEAGEPWDLLPPSDFPNWDYLGTEGWVPVQMHASWYFPTPPNPEDFYRLEMSAWPVDCTPSSVTVKFVGVGPVIVPAPGAILLGTLGAGLVGWLCRRRAL